MRYFLFTIILISSLSQSYAYDTLYVLPTHPLDTFYRLTQRNLEVMEDPEGKFSFEEVRNMKFNRIEDHQISETREFIFPQPHSGYYWFKFSIANKRKDYNYWMVEFLDFNMEELYIYIPDKNGHYREATTGFALPFLQREIIHKNFEFDIPLSENIQTIYVRVLPGTANLFPVEIKSYHGFIKYSTVEYYLLGLFYGIILVMGIYNLILYINMNEKHYLFYVFYVICVASSSMCHDGTGFQFLWPGYPHLNDQILLLSLFGLVMWTLFYSKWFLNTAANARDTDKIIKYLIWASAVLLVTVEVFKPANSSYLIALAIVPFVIIHITASKIYMKGYKPARFFLMAFSFFLTGYVIRILAFFNVIGGTIFTVYSYNIGILVEMILFSIAIGDRIKTLKQEKERALIEKEKAQSLVIQQLQENEKLKDKVNKELEEKVTQRTQEIKQKNQELEVANEQLKLLTDQVNQWNIRLDLDNRKLQTNIKEIAQARVMLKDVKFDEFSTVFPDEKSCLKYLSDLKWKEGYSCKKCRNNNYGKGKSLFARRCTKCNYDESPTNDTLFHRLRFPITKAFYMVYLVSNKDKDITADELSEILTLRRETCWSFKRKILLARKNVKKTAITEEADGWAALALISIN